MVEAIRRLRPRVVLLQHWEQRHPDHAAASRIVYDACFLAGLRNYRPDLGPAFRPAKLVYAVTMTEANDLAPTFVVDVTPFWETKLRAISAFVSQFTPGPRRDRRRCRSTASRKRSSSPAAATARGSACATARAS